MAARNSRPDEQPTAATAPAPAPAPEQQAPEQPNAAVIRTQEYAAGEGWGVGQAAPADAFRALDAAGTGEPMGPVVHEHPGGYARQIVAKGQVITDGVKAELDAVEQSGSASEGEQG